MENTVLDTTQAKALIESPIFQLNGENYVANVVKATEHNVYFEFHKITNPPNLLKRWLISLRAISLTVMIIPVLMVYLYATKLGWSASLGVAISTALIPALLLLAVNLLNDVADHERLIDLKGSLGGSQVIQRGWLPPTALKRMAYAFITVAALLSAPLIYQHPFELSVIAVATLMATLGYSGKTLAFKYRALGDLVVFLMCGPVLTASYAWAVFGQFDLQLVYYGVLYGLLACAILHANNLNDIPTDAASGAKTVAILLGFKVSKHFMLSIYLGVGIILLIPPANSFARASHLPALVVFSFLVSQFMHRIYQAKSPQDPSIADIRFIAPQIHLITGVLLCLGLLLPTTF